MTKGEYRVGINFNPSNDDAVGNIKRQAADLIDLIFDIEDESMNPERDVERKRLKALAMTCVEEGAMWAVKAATKT